MEQIIFMILKLAIFLPLVLFLIIVSFKYGGNKLQNVQNGKFISILEKVALSKENSLLVVKIGKKAYVISSASNKVEILMELSEEEIMQLKKNKTADLNKDFNKFLSKIRDKFKDKREE